MTGSIGGYGVLWERLVTETRVIKGSKEIGETTMATRKRERKGSIDQMRCYATSMV